MRATAIRQTLLENGAVMGREEFHRLFEQCEELERAELVEGVVYLPSGVSTLYHGRQLALVLQWLVHYELLHDPDVEAVGPTSILLDDLNEPLPDATLFRIRADRFEGGYIKGAPS